MFRFYNTQNEEKKRDCVFLFVTIKSKNKISISVPSCWGHKKLHSLKAVKVYILFKNRFCIEMKDLRQSHKCDIIAKYTLLSHVYYKQLFELQNLGNPLPQKTFKKDTA